MSTFLTDAFSGSAGTNLSAHTPDSGGSWAALSAGTEPFQLDGSGKLTIAATSSVAMGYSAPADPWVPWRHSVDLSLTAAPSGAMPGPIITENVNNRGYRLISFSGTLYLQTQDGGVTIGSVGDTLTSGNTYTLRISYDPLTQTVTGENVTTGKTLSGVDQTYVPRYAGLASHGATATSNYKLGNASGVTYEPTLAAGGSWATPLSATSVLATCKPPTGGRAPYSIQFQESVNGGAYANAGTASADTALVRTGLSGANTYAYKVVVTDALSATNTGAASSAVTPAAPTASGLVEYLLDATRVNTIDAGVASHGTALLYDDDLATYYQSAAVNDAWAGIDLGAGVLGALTAVDVANTSQYGNETKLFGAELRASGASTGPWSHLGVLPDGTVAGGGIVATYEFTRLALTAAGGHRYFRLLVVPANIQAGELRLTGYWATGVPWRPCAPVLTPGAGRLPNGSTVTMSCPTTDALIYYTVDGSTPTTGSTLYPGPVVLPTNATTTVKAIASHASGTATTSHVTTGVFTCPKKFVNDSGTFTLGGANHNPEVLYDTTGRRAQVHYGGLFLDPASNQFYWFGQDHRTPTSGASVIPRMIVLYNCADLFNPVPVGPIIGLPPSTYTDAGTYLDTVNRGKVLYNASPGDTNKRYVFVCRLDATTTGYTSGQIGFVTAPAMTGPWTWANHVLPTGATHVGDLNIFTDPADGKAKVVFNDNNTAIKVAVLDPATDNTSLTADALVTVYSANREAPALTITGGWYYLLTSDGIAYGDAGPSNLAYQSATTLAGLNSSSPVSVWSSVPAATDAAYSMQSVCFTSVPGLDKVLLVCDWGDSGASPVKMYDAQSGVYAANFDGGLLSVTPTAEFLDLSVAFARVGGEGPANKVIRPAAFAPGSPK